TADTNKQDLATMMVGREVSLTREMPPVEIGEPRLVVEGVTAVNADGHKILNNIDLKVRAGEIVGVAGISGNGQRPLAESVAGLQGLVNGRVALDGQDVTQMSPAQRLATGFSYIPEERMHDGVIKDFSVAENFILQDHIHAPYSKGIFLNFKHIAQHARDLIKSFNVKTPSRETPVKNLSGGNIQKLILARELARKPRVLIAAQPTRGVDIGATEYIHARLIEERTKGTATLLISEDLDEVMALSDRIVVIFHGQVMGELSREEATPEKLGLMMAGETS
ncbi:MAG: ATP-binding cassette domain-containing protein, partial [Chloroflexi bacterium]|nr:ATP-binding cassette domain-containing protein [Chloroflexota bacterium]